jgi:PAS domain S-box-containing protein
MSPTPASTIVPDTDKTREQLLSELQELRAQVAILREAEAKSKSIAEALRVSEASLARSQVITHMGGWELDVRTNRVRGSDELYRMFDLGPDVTLDAYVEKMHPEDRACVVEAIDAAIYGGKPYNIDYRIVPRPGEIRYVHAEGEVARDENGLPVKFFGTVQDITELKKAQDLINKERQRFFSLLDGLPAFVYLLARDHSIRFVNQSFRKTFGEPQNRPCYETIRCSDKPCPDCPTFKIFDTLKPEQWELTTTTGNTYQIYDYPFRDIDGTPLVLSMGIDITERKRAEEELNEAKQQAELYLDLMGHDINNMNQIALGFLEIALGSYHLSDEERQFLEKPMDTLKNSSRLIDNVRKLRKLKVGGLKHKKIDLCDILIEVKADYSHIPGRDATINFKPVPQCHIIANELVKDLFSNLVGNAIKHSDPRKPLVINIGLERVTEERKEYFKVLVEDNGPGIQDELKEKLFARFEQGQTRKGVKGLGLYLVRKLVEDFHGRIWVEDRVRGDYTKGCRFIVMLPVVEM